MNKSYLQTFILIVVVEFSVLLAGFWMLGDYDVKRFNVWPISEWLINYQAGFVRRGLMGEVLRQLNHPDPILPFLNPIILSFYYAYVVIYISIYLQSKIRSWLVLIMGLLIPGGIFHMATGTLFYPRKEILFLIHFGLLCLLYMRIQAAPYFGKSHNIIAFVSIAIIGGVLLTLIHEPYLFMGYPVTALLFFILHKENPNNRYAKWGLYTYLSMMLGIFLLCSYYHGDFVTSQVIWDSYTLSDRVSLAPVAPYTAAFATAGLGWSLAQHFSTIYGVYLTGTWIIWLFFLFANALVLIYMTIKIQDAIKRRAYADIVGSQVQTISSYLTYVLLAFCISLTMFLIASDYGRWIACASNLTMLFMFSTTNSSYVKKIRHEKLICLNNFSERLIKASCSIAVPISLLAYELIFQMPESCIRGDDLLIRYDKFLLLFFE